MPSSRGGGDRHSNGGSRADGSPHAAGKLAPGMRLPRKVVAESQRERLMIAMIELVDRQGFPDTSVAELTARAHVSRSAFYEHFGSTEACFAAAYDTHVARCAGALISVYNTPGLQREPRAEAALGALTGFAQVWPAAARVCLGDILTVAGGAIERRAEARTAAQHMLAAALGQDGVHTELLPSLTTAAIGAVRRVVYTHLRDAPRHHKLPGLGGELLDWILTYDHRLSEPLAATGRSGQAGARADRRMQRSPGEGPRERIMRAILELAASKDSQSITHREIAATAQVSYGTFYKHFKDKQQAQLAACEAVREQLLRHGRDALAAAADWPTGVRDALAAYFNAAAADPDATRVMALDTLSLGRAGLQFHEERAEGIKSLLLNPSPPTGIKRPGATIPIALTGAIIEIIHEHALKRRIQRLPELVPELTYIALAPFIGAEHAAQIASEPLAA